MCPNHLWAWSRGGVWGFVSETKAQNSSVSSATLRHRAVSFCPADWKGGVARIRRGRAVGVGWPLSRLSLLLHLARNYMCHTAREHKNQRVKQAVAATTSNFFGHCTCGFLMLPYAQPLGRDPCFLLFILPNWKNSNNDNKYNNNKRPQDSFSLATDWSHSTWNKMRQRWTVAQSNGNNMRRISWNILVFDRKVCWTYVATSANIKLSCF